MQGFDPEFRDLPDYILNITERIWEGREIGAIRHFYAADCPVRSPAGITSGAENVVAATLATLAEFPDRRLLGEDVVWTGDSEAGFMSSHRILSTATHLGDGVCGPATGRTLRYRVIADCAARKNQIFEEWLVRDQGAIARGLGKTPRETAAAQIAAGNAGFFLPENDTPGRWDPVLETAGPAAAYAEVWRRIWEEKDLSAIAGGYDPAAILEGPGGLAHAGHSGIERFYLEWLSAFPGAAFQVEHLFALEEPKRETRAAMRWSVRGVHTGFGAFGSPSGADVYVMGISHARIVEGKIAAEWVLADEVAIWKQILVGQKSAVGPGPD